MSNIISDFLINPVLQQARRFSRSSTPSDPIEPLRNGANHRTATSSGLEDAIEDTYLEIDEVGYVPNAPRNEARHPNLSGNPQTSPLLNGEHLENVLAGSETEEGATHSTALGHPHMLPIRLASIRQIDSQAHDVLNNTSHDIPDRVLAESSMNTSLSRNQNAPDAGTGYTANISQESTQDSSRSGESTSQKNSSLPEDDGMGHLRKQIIQIQDMDVGAEAKARMVHQLLMQGYIQARTVVNSKTELKPHSTTSIISQERPTTPGSLSSFSFWQHSLSPDAVSPNSQHTFHLSPDDLKRTYAPAGPAEVEELGDDGAERTKEIPVLGCQHYKRNTNLKIDLRYRAIEAQPMPPQFQDTKAMVSCNDCYAKSAVKYHWLGLKCAICDSYNTVQLSILSDPEETRVMESVEAENATDADHRVTESSTSGRLRPEPGRSRRYSSQTLPSLTSGPTALPYPTPLRLGRSVSPTLGPSFLDDSMAIETDDSADEDELDFWGRDTSRSPTFVDHTGESDEGEDDDDESLADDCDEEDADEEEDQFELIGHR
ncbi:hypothetical protein B7463_g10292, partial [Scytalidium lignicola]